MPLQPSEDLFEDTRMSFGEHLEELRKVLVKSLIGLAIGVGVAMIFADKIVLYLQTPLENAIREFQRGEAEKQLAAVNDGIVPPEVQPLLDQDRLIPRKLKVEPDELLDLLQEHYPALTPGERRSPHAFRPSQLSLDRTAIIAKRLTSQASSDAEKAISARLTQEERDRLTEIAATDSPTAAQRQQLLDVLDRLAQSDDLYSDAQMEEAYAGVVPSGEGFMGWYTRLTRSFSAPQREDAAQGLRRRLQTQDDPEQRRRLQRLLISRSLAPDLAPVRAELAELEVWESTKMTAQALKVEEVFMVWLKAALIAGVVFSSPWVFFQIWTFVAAGLYPHEKRYVHLYLPMSISLFLGGVLLAFFGAFQPVLMFLFQFNASMGIDPQPRIGEWLTFVMILPLGFGIAFQLPLVMLFINRIGLVSVEAYLEKWRIAILVIFVVAMILTPADPISMLLLAIPLSFLYFGGILLCRWLPKNRNPFQQAYDPA